MGRAGLRLACVLLIIALLIGGVLLSRMDQREVIATGWSGEPPTAWIGEEAWSSVTVRYERRRLHRRGTPFPLSGRTFDVLSVVVVREDGSEAVFREPAELRGEAIARLQASAGASPLVRTMPPGLAESDQIRVQSTRWGLALNALFLSALLTLLLTFWRSGSRVDSRA